MKKINDGAVSEVIGGILIVFIAVAVSVTIYMQMLPVPLPPPEPNVHLMGYVTEDGTAIIQHMGGEKLSSYEIHVYGPNGIDIKKYEDEEDSWEIGRCIPILTENDEIQITVYSVYDDGSKQVVFNGILKLEKMQDEFFPLIHPMLISSLRTDTTDEDLICYTYFIDPGINDSTYIYRWIVDGKPLTEILMPFDTKNTTITKDYSGNGYNGSIVGATWTEEGKVGGAYYFDGASDYIAMDSFLFNISNDFTISVWIKSNAIAAPFRTILGVSDTEKDFVLIFQQNNKIHFCTYKDGERKAVETETLASDTWYHIAGVWDPREKSMALYVNGTISIEPGFEHFPMGSYKSGFVIGRRIDGSRYWLGFIDEVEIYNRALSAEQIYQIYLSTKDGYSDKRVIVSEETCLDNVWQCMVTPNDGTQDVATMGSNLLKIKTYISPQSHGESSEEEVEEEVRR